jgi:hypothetical protein
MLQHFVSTCLDVLIFVTLESTKKKPSLKQFSDFGTNHRMKKRTSYLGADFPLAIESGRGRG